MASCELQEEILVQLFSAGPLPRRQENVAPDVLVHDAAAGRHAAEGHVDVLVKLDGHLQSGQSEGLVGEGEESSPRPALAGPGRGPLEPALALALTLGPPAGCPS